MPTPCTDTGTSDCTIELFPNWPYALFPQHTTVPARATPHECRRPSAIVGFTNAARCETAATGAILQTRPNKATPTTSRTRRIPHPRNNPCPIARSPAPSLCARLENVTPDGLPLVAHWINGKRFEGPSARTGEVFDPATGRVTKRVAFASPADVDAAVAAAGAAFGAWRAASLTERTKVLFRFRELLHLRSRGAGRDHHDRARQGAERRARRGDPWARGRGVRVRDAAAAQGRLLRRRVVAGSTCTRSASRSASSPIISPFNFPAMVPCWFFPIAIAAGNAVIVKPSEKDPSAANWMAELWAEAGLPAGVFNVVHGDKVAVDALLEHPEREGGLVRRVDAGRPATSTRPRRAPASACRRSAARRTTWSCCPTPTSISRPTPRSTPDSARPANAAWRSRRSSRSARSPTSSSRRSSSGSTG